MGTARSGHLLPSNATTFLGEATRAARRRVRKSRGVRRLQADLARHDPPARARTCAARRRLLGSRRGRDRGASRRFGGATSRRSGGASLERHPRACRRSRSGWRHCWRRGRVHVCHASHRVGWDVDRNVAIGCRPNRRTAHVLHGPHERRASPRRSHRADRRIGPLAALLGCLPSRRRGPRGGPRQARGLARKRASARARSPERARSPKALLDVAGREHRATPNGPRARGRRFYRSASGRTA